MHDLNGVSLISWRHWHMIFLEDPLMSIYVKNTYYTFNYKRNKTFCLKIATITDKIACKFCESNCCATY